MTIDENKRLEDALNAVYDSKEYKTLINIVIELSESETCNKGSYNNIFPNVERLIDDLATRCGWIYDMLQGKPKRGLSKFQKIRKLLGYTYP